MVIQEHVQDYLFRGDLIDFDPDVAELIRHETARQARYLIMIPSESTVPYAVREALSSAFHNIYAEGYPLDSNRTLTEEEILDYEARLTEYRRAGDRRYYKGTEYANIVESLARRRAAEVFAANGLRPEQLFVNVQPLSGAPANSAVYTGLLQVGDTVMGMDLAQGGHLTHGSPVNRSGKYYKIISYGVDPVTEQIDYDKMLALALEHKPKMIIGGFTSYPWAADWRKFREIADAVGAYLMADVSHVSGMIAAGVYPSPVGIADVVTFTTHKTLNGPRGAVIITHRKDLYAKIDRGVFPGEQGGPHINNIAGLAVALKLAQTDQFRALQQQTVVNAERLARKLAERGMRIPYGGTDTHMLSLDCRSVVGPDGTTLPGDYAARILDLVGIVCNFQTIPGDVSALRPSGIRLGTPWITQRGFGEAEIDELGDIIADVLQACVPYTLSSRKRPVARAKLPFEVLQDARLRVRDLALRVGIDTDAQADGYPHFDYLPAIEDEANPQTLLVKGEEAQAFLNTALTADVANMRVGDYQLTAMLTPQGEAVAGGIVEMVAEEEYALHLERNAAYAATWLRSLSDGFVLIEPDDPYARIIGPVIVRHVGAADLSKFEIDINYEIEWKQGDLGYADNKTTFIGRGGQHYNGPTGAALPEFTWEEPIEEAGAELKTTTLHSLHKQMNAKMVPFAGYDMPVWYTSVTNEHLAVRQSAGVFDVSHMGVFDIRGRGAAAFLDVVTTNDVSALEVGQSHYTYFLDVHGQPLDDLMIYRLAADYFLIVVNASNNDKVWAWLKAVKNQDVMIDPAHPGRVADGAATCILRDLRDRSVGSEMRVDIALQGPKAKDILLSLEGLEEDKQAVAALPWAGVTYAHLGGFDLIVSRTGYTGERTAYELFVHPDAAAELVVKLVEAGAAPCGLAARDSLRTEAGLPLYGHELAGPLSLNPADAGFDNYVKVYKPFFVGRSAYLAHERERDAEIVRFRLENKGARPPHQGDPLVDSRGRVVGIVTSCSIDSEGYQLGQAYVKLDYTDEGTKLGVFAGASRTKAADMSTLKLGDKLPVPDSVVVLSRFPKPKK
jgi:glycine hydroxymethyltransferase